jgi:hypothetical protein
LAYFDAPGAVASAKTLVNDLDLRLINEAGETFALNDRVNNVEMIERAGLPAGRYSITVHGLSVPMGKSGKQPYALIVSMN